MVPDAYDSVEKLLEMKKGFFKRASHLVKALSLCGTGEEPLKFFRMCLKEIFDKTGKDCDSSELIEAVENHPHCPVERWEGPIMRAKKLAGVKFELPLAHVQNLAIQPKAGANIEDLIMNQTDDDEDDNKALDLPPVKRFNGDDDDDEPKGDGKPEPGNGD